MSQALEQQTPSASSPTLSPTDHLKLLVELLRPAGPELGRRWLAALLLVPSDQREALVREVERRVVALHAAAASDARTTDDTAPAESRDGSPVVHIRTPPRARDGYSEEIETTFATSATKPVKKRKHA